jgi:hypothetical protein
MQRVHACSAYWLHMDSRRPIRHIRVTAENKIMIGRGERSSSHRRRQFNGTSWSDSRSCSSWL